MSHPINAFLWFVASSIAVVSILLLLLSLSHFHIVDGRFRKDYGSSPSPFFLTIVGVFLAIAAVIIFVLWAVTGQDFPAVAKYMLGASILASGLVVQRQYKVFKD